MLLSHNFDLPPDSMAPLSREEFAEVFRSGLGSPLLQSKLINHPHWIVEIRFSTAQFSPTQVGKLCGQALANHRRTHEGTQSFPKVLVLGGVKTSPPTSTSPDALQPGEWGVDVVETRSTTAFLQTIGWEATITQKAADTIFKVEL